MPILRLLLLPLSKIFPSVFPYPIPHATVNVASLVTIRLSHSYKVSHATIPFLIHDPPIGKG